MCVLFAAEKRSADDREMALGGQRFEPLLHDPAHVRIEPFDVGSFTELRTA